MEKFPVACNSVKRTWYAGKKRGLLGRKLELWNPQGWGQKEAMVGLGWVLHTGVLLKAVEPMYGGTQVHPTAGSFNFSAAILFP